MLANLTPGQRPLIRIGGDSADHSTVPIPGYANPGVFDTWGPDWMAAARQIAQSTGAQLVPDLDLEADDPAVPAQEADQMEAEIGSAYVPAFELGNEPDIYSQLPWYDSPGGSVLGREPGWNPALYADQLAATVPDLPGLDFWGPALGANSRWWGALPEIADAIPNLRTISYHAYGTSCYAPPGSPLRPSVAHLLAPAASVGLAEAVRPEVAFARETHRSVRIDEINTVTCAGRESIPGFAAALWALEAGFNFARVGVRGLNVHMFPTAAYRLFSFSPDSTAVTTADEYYGWMLLARAAPPGSHRLLSQVTGNQQVRAFATALSSHGVGFGGVAASTSTTGDTVVLINADPRRSSTVTLDDPRRTRAVIEDLRSPNLAATTGVSFAGMAILPSTGRLAGIPRASALAGQGSYSIVLPPASADLVTLTTP